MVRRVVLEFGKTFRVRVRVSIRVRAKKNTLSGDDEPNYKGQGCHWKRYWVALQ